MGLDLLSSIFETNEGEIEALAKKLFEKHTGEALSDSREFLHESRADLQQYFSQLLAGTIGPDELRSLIQSRIELLEMRALKSAGLPQTSIDMFATGVVDIVIRAVLDAAGERLSPSSGEGSKKSRARAPMPPAEFSSSVQLAAKTLGPDQMVNSWAIVKQLCKQHPEYGDNKAKELSRESGPATLTAKPLRQWLEEIRGVAVVPKDKIIDGRSAIVALSRIDPALADYLVPSRFLQLLNKELGNPPDSPSLQEARPKAPSDPTPLHIDNPASADHLGRKAFARALALRLERIWDENHAANDDSSFVLHLHGPWGSGKSSLLNLLRQYLQPEAGNKLSRWIVVEFNAWQNQRINPPWWPLLDRIYRQALQQIRCRYKERKRWLSLRLRELWWRFITANREHVLLGISILLLTTLLAIVAWHYAPKLSIPAVDVSGKAISAIVALVGLITALSSFATRALLSGSASAAQKFVRSAVDPMARIAAHFQDLITWIDHPIIIFIDDLDRCRSEYVVSLLEGIQTLFKDRRVIYVISADRRWIYACYENVYEKFVATVREPGRDLGCLFLEKAVQLSVSLPRLSESLQATFWDYLIHGQDEGVRQQVEKAATDARRELEGAFTPEEISAKLKSTSDPIQEHARREEAVMRLATERAEASTEYFLKDFARLLEPNPRAMKRLLNAYALHRDMAILSGLDVLGNLKMRKQLVLWTIVCLRWPLLEQILIDNIDYVNAIHGRKTVAGIPEELRPLLKRESIQRVFQGEGVGVTLDKQIIQDFAELRTSNSSSAAVG